MTALATIDAPAPPRRGRLKPPAEVVVPTRPVAIVVPSSPQPFALGSLRRAPENVRHTRMDEDIDGLADDIAAHGLLSCLIAYVSDWPDDAGKAFVVGGGRRLQALNVLLTRGVIDADFPVPVLIRDIEDAIELSLAENLQQRVMSPVDEFLGFKALMDRGTASPASLAKRFGFTERVVKQRLRLADLAPPILDALAARDISIDAAMAYAATQDRDLQADVFRAEQKKSWEKHKPRDIKYALAMKGISTDNPLFLFVGEDGYTGRGGAFEDDLFNDEKRERTLTSPGLLQTAARDMIDFQMIRLLPELRARKDLAPTIIGYLIASDLRIKGWGNTAPKPPAGFVAVEKYEHQALWKTIRNNGIKVHVLVGIDDKGVLVPWPRTVFVPKAQKDALDPPQPGYSYTLETDEARAARERNAGIERWARRLAVGPFAGTPFEGRAFWPTYYDDRTRPAEVGGVPGHLVDVRIFVTAQAIAENMVAAETEYDRDTAEKAKAEAEERATEAAARAQYDALQAMEPPAVVVVDGEAWERTDEGAYVAAGDDGFVGSWAALLANFKIADIGETFATREAFDAAMAHAGADEVTA